MFGSLSPDRSPAWGKMSVGQMLEHCARFNELCLGRIRPGWPIRLLARCLGPLFLRKLMGKSATEGPRELATLPQIRVVDPVDFAAAQARLQDAILGLRDLPAGHRHPLYGMMSGDDVRTLARYHMGHHAHQFRLW